MKQIKKNAAVRLQIAKHPDNGTSASLRTAVVAAQASAKFITASFTANSPAINTKKP